MAKDTAKIVIEMGDAKPKKHVTRYDADDSDAAVANVYVSKTALKELGDPEEITVTIKAR